MQAGHAHVVGADHLTAHLARHPGGFVGSSRVRRAGLQDERGNIPGLRRILGVDAVSASIGGLFGVSSVTSYVESAAGVAEGARTGLHELNAWARDAATDAANTTAAMGDQGVHAGHLRSTVPEPYTAEYAVATMAAVGFAGLLVIILRGDEVRGILTDLVRNALTVG